MRGAELSAPLFVFGAVRGTVFSETPYAPCLGGFVENRAPNGLELSSGSCGVPPLRGVCLRRRLGPGERLLPSKWAPMGTKAKIPS